MKIKTPIVKTIGTIYIPYIFLYALYIQINGEVSPGGGFQAGVIFASGLVAYDLIYGIKALEAHTSKRILLAGGVVGVMLYALVGVVTMVMGGNFLDYSVLQASYHTTETITDAITTNDHLAHHLALTDQGTSLSSASINKPNPHGQHLGIFIIELGVGITVTSIMSLIYAILRSKEESHSV